MTVQNEGGATIEWTQVARWVLGLGQWDDDGVWVDTSLWQDNSMWTDVSTGDRTD